MPSLNPIDRAYRRHQILRLMLEHHREMARSPTYRRNLVKLGFVDEGEKPQIAEQIVKETFDELSGLIAHLAIVDMAAALEFAAKSKIGNASGQVRKAYKERKDKTKEAVYASRLVLDQDFFKTLKSISDLVDSFLDKDVMEAFSATKDARNNFAHGTNVTTMPVIDVEDARAALNEVFDIL